MYFLNKNNENCLELKKYRFAAEDEIQEVLRNNPEILLSNSELNISPYENIISIREYQTNRGPIDLVYITDNGDIIIVETKLLRNPESHRTVVAQAIDYAKSFSEENIDLLKDKLNKRNIDFTLNKNNGFIESIIDKNIKIGNYQILIVGDEIHSNILGMIDSIQSAPHLSFTVNAISLNPHKINNDIIINTKLEAKTLEIERSVISIEIINNNIKIDSSSPEKENTGNKPKISEEEFINNFENPEFIEVLKYLWDEIKNNDGTIDWGIAGFSGGYRQNNKRISLIWVYDKKFNILSKKVRNSYNNITDEQYNSYLNKLKESDHIYEKVVVPNRSEVNFKDIEIRDFKIAVEAILFLMKDMIKNENNSI